MRKEAIVAFLVVLSVIASGCINISNDDDDNSSGPSRGVGAELLSNNHAVMPGEATDFVLLVENQGPYNDTFTVEVESNNGGFDIQIESGFESVMVSPGARVPLLVNVVSPSSGELYGHLVVRSQNDTSVTATVRFNVSATSSFGNLSAIGDTVEVQYAGILARNGMMFDTNLEWLEQSDYPRFAEMDLPHCGPGENPQNANCYTPHYNLLCAWEIGVPSADKGPNPPQPCGGMIPGFDARLVGMYEGQTLAVRIPARDAYGENPSQGKLGGEDLIFSVTMIDVSNHPPQAVIATDPTDGQVQVNETVKFQGYQSSDPDNDPLTYAWDFGDDGSSSEASVSHAYNAEGNYTVRLTVTDSGELSDFAEKVITVTEQRVETFQDGGTVSCPVIPGFECDKEEFQFVIKQDATLVSAAWNLSQNGFQIMNAQVTIIIYNATGANVYNETGQGEGEYFTEFSGIDLESLGEWKWEIEAEQGSMDWEVTIRVEY